MSMTPSDAYLVAGGNIAASGVLPVGTALATLEATTDSVYSTHITVEDSTNPGVDPISPSVYRSGLAGGNWWMYDPAQNEVRKVINMQPVLTDKTAIFVVESAFTNPLAASAIQMVKPEFSSVAWSNTGAGSATVNGQAVPAGLSANWDKTDVHGFVNPVTYANSAGTLRFTVSKNI